MEASFGGLTFKGGKIFALLVALSTLGGGLYGGFEFWKKFQDMSAAIEAYTSPDLSGFDKRIDLVQQEVTMLQSEMSMILEEVQLVASTAKELRDDLKSSIRQLQSDSRHIETIVDSIKNKTRDELRLFEDDIKELEADLELRIQKTLENPLNNMAVVK